MLTDRLTEARAIETPAPQCAPTQALDAHQVYACGVRPEVPADSSGPVHSVDTEHVVRRCPQASFTQRWTARVTRQTTGDCLVLPAGSQRQLSGVPEGRSHSQAPLPAVPQR
jgi:hypothetical protein